MRTLLVGVVSSFVALVGFASTANAAASLELLWSGSGTANTSSVSSSALVTLNVVVTAGVEGGGGQGYTIDYSGATTKVAFISAGNVSSAAFGQVFGTIIDTGTSVIGMNISTNVGGTALAPGGTAIVGTLVFHKAGDPGTFNIGINTSGGTDGVVGADGNSVAVNFSGATLTNAAVPEPGTVSLLALGLGGLALAGRRRS